MGIHQKYLSKGPGTLASTFRSTNLLRLIFLQETPETILLYRNQVFPVAIKEAIVSQEKRCQSAFCTCVPVVSIPVPAYGKYFTLPLSNDVSALAVDGGALSE